MASLGHVAVGMAAGKNGGLRAALGWSALAMLPDADVIGFAMGVRYADPWGHRGATHSLAFALAVAAAVAALAPALGLPRRRAGVTAALALASHGLLDTLTDGGLGVALLWPFDLTRYFAPWRPIPVSPIGLAFLSPYGLTVAGTELALFAPLFAYAIGRPRLAWGWLSTWLIVVWLLASTDPIRQRVMSAALREDTQYANGYSESAFSAVRIGQAIDEVRRGVGEPLEQGWFYFTDDSEPDPAKPETWPLCPALFVEADRVTKWPVRGVPVRERCERAGIRVGMPVTDVTARLGAPAGMCWSYSRSPSRAYFRSRVVCFEFGKVLDVMRRWERTTE